MIRNRVKRRIREWFRRGRPLTRAVDIVVIVRRAAAELEWSELDRSLSSLVARAVREA